MNRHNYPSDNLMEFLDCIGLKVTAILWCSEWAIRYQLAPEGDSNAGRSLNVIQRMFQSAPSTAWAAMYLYSDAYPGEIVDDDATAELFTLIQRALRGDKMATETLHRGPRFILSARTLKPSANQISG